MHSLQLSSEDNALIQKVLSHLGTRTDAHVFPNRRAQYPLDLTDPDALSYVKLMHRICGHTEELYPGLHLMLDMAAKQPRQAALAATASEDGWVTGFNISEFGYSSDTQLATANASGTVVGGFQVCNLSLLVQAPDGTILSHGSAVAFTPQNTLVVITDKGTATAYVPGAKAILTYTYITADGQVYSGTTASQWPGAASNPSVVEPKQENGNTNSYNAKAICIGLGRPTGYNTHCDYTFYEKAQNNPVGRLPLVGSVTFTYPIKTLDPEKNFYIDLYVIRDSGGQTQKLEPSDLDQLYSSFSIDPADSKKLTWNLPMEANRIPAESGVTYNPVVFTKIPWSTEMVAYLTCNIIVTLDNGTESGLASTVTIQSVPDTVTKTQADTDQINGVTYIRPIEFVWHCLGENTKVQLADGSQKAIQNLVAGDEVVGPGGKKQIVSVTHKAQHFTSVYVLKLDSGAELVASAEHMVLTAKLALARVCTLAVGDELATVDGTSAITEIHEEPGGGQVLWNISLGTAPYPDGLESEEPYPVGEIFIANGIMVGDARASRAQRYRQIRDIDWVKAHVSETLHRDVETAFRLKKIAAM